MIHGISSFVFIARQHTDARYWYSKSVFSSVGLSVRDVPVSRFSTNKPLYLANDTKYRHRYYERRIGTRMRSIKWCHFQWPWTNRNPVFKVTPLFDAKYLTNGYKYCHSYYTRRLGNRTQASEWHWFQWPWVTSDPHFKVTIIFNVQ